ncbi:MAG: transposase, partial [Acidobacteriota bacterium]
PLWAQIVEQGQHFLVRVGGNVQLLLARTDCAIHLHKDEVLCWPLTAQQANSPPLRLRLVRVRLGKQRMWMLTNVLQRKRLSPSQIVAFYKMRWGIEIEFRGLKQTLDCAKLCCRTGQRLLVELHWSILAMAVAELFALKEQLAVTGNEAMAEQRLPDPKKRSLANAIRALRFCLTHLKDIPEPNEDIRSQLRRAVTDSYVRTSSKRARYRPPNPDKKSLGDPKIRRLTPEETKKLNALTQSKSVT